MVGDLRESLEPIGKLALLERVGNKAMDYFATVDPTDISNPGLANQVQVLTQIGSIRLAEHQHEAAVDVFWQAFERSAILTTKNPGDTDLLFARGQAEFWVGFAHWEQGDLESAAKWMVRYRDTGITLLQFDESNIEWQREVGYGHHNIGAIELKRGNISAATDAFERELALLTQLSASLDDDDQLQADIADCHSWLGNSLEFAGRPQQALAYFRLSREAWESLHRSAPEHAGYIQWYANALVLEFNAHRQVTGQREHYAPLERALEMRRRLTEIDSDNTSWLVDYHKLRVFKLEHVLAFEHDDVEVATELMESLDAMQRLNIEANDSSELARTALLRAYRLAALVEYNGGNRDLALEHLERAIKLSPTAGTGTLNVELVTQRSASRRLRAEILAATGDSDHKAAALESIAGMAENSQHPAILSEYARALALNDRLDEASEVSSQLQAMGYQPLWPISY
jgi:serine/threonine-protein kinase